MSSASSAFDPDQFLATPINEKGSTEYINVPPGTWPAQGTKVDLEDGSTDGKPWKKVNFHWEITGVPEVTIKTGRETNPVRETFFLELDENGRLDTSDGKNVKLNKFREEHGLVGQSLNGFVGKGGRVVVEHNMSKKDSKVYANVKASMRL